MHYNLGSCIPSSEVGLCYLISTCGHVIAWCFIQCFIQTLWYPKVNIQLFLDQSAKKTCAGPTISCKIKRYDTIWRPRHVAIVMVIVPTKKKISRNAITSGFKVIFWTPSLVGNLTCHLFQTRYTRNYDVPSISLSNM